MTGDPEAIVDPISGLFTEAFLRATLPTRVATARRAMKQLGFVILNVTSSDPAAPGGDLGTVGSLIHDTLRDSDTGVVLESGWFALVLEFTPVEGCVTIANRLIDRITAADPKLSTCAGVASYPVHAMDATELLEAADRTVRDAIAAGPGTVSVSPIAD